MILFFILLAHIQASPVSATKAKRTPKIVTKKIENTTKKIKLAMLEELGLQNEIDKENLFEELLNNLKVAYEKSEVSEKFKILTLLPQSMSVTYIRKEFNVSVEQVEKAKEVQSMKGMAKIYDFHLILQYKVLRFLVLS